MTIDQSIEMTSYGILSAARPLTGSKDTEPQAAFCNPHQIRESHVYSWRANLANVCAKEIAEIVRRKSDI